MSNPQNTTAGVFPRRSLTRVRALTVTAMLSAIAFVLMFLDFSVPLIPSFVKMDISELPALLAAFALGPVYGTVVCLVKNLIHLMITSTAGAGELCNFLLGASFVIPAGLLYRRMKSRKGALIGVLIGSVIMALFSIPLNYYVTYPIYSNFMPIDAILGMYQAIRPSVNSLLECLIVFNAPFTLVKGLIDAALCFLIYKSLSPILHKGM
ncbi:ECF transporter S component [Pseudoflavonifractor sp. DSM 107456]|uniref:Riboflavin transporter n=2 Tax=Pseudoflavonifractor TaxID=1017280 RepID=A0ABR9RC26_9FIRM|nr:MULTISPECIES: ECF transporter S component [Eubacteriales]MBC5729312.1 ECF transporter S component [Pseudoflavonifractor hominis]MBE5055898.1 ECF transporter S component [Pseudoflavonifractor gallinarum]